MYAGSMTTKKEKLTIIICYSYRMPVLGLLQRGLQAHGLAEGEDVARVKESKTLWHTCYASVKQGKLVVYPLVKKTMVSNTGNPRKKLVMASKPEMDLTLKGKSKERDDVTLFVLMT